jgi:predicted permease
MFDIFLLVLPIFLVMFLGNALLRMKLINEPFINTANKLIFNVCLPVLLFFKISQSAFSDVFNPQLLLIMLTAVGIMFPASFLVGGITRTSKRSVGTFAMNNFRANYAYMGLPVSYYAFGEPGLAIGSILMAFIVPYVNVLSVAALSLTGGGGFDKRTFLKNTLLNPLAIACVLGILFSVFQIPVVDFLYRTMEIISGVTLPLALFAIGATLSRDRIRGSMPIITTSIIMKLVLLPLIAYGIFRIFGIPVGLPEKVLIVMLSAPSATVNYVLASVMGGDSDLAAGTIVLGTTVSIFSFVFWLHTLGV